MPAPRNLMLDLAAFQRARLARRSERALLIFSMVLFALGAWAIYTRYRVHTTKVAFEEAYDRRMALFEQRRAWEGDRLALRDILYRKTFDEDASKRDSSYRDFIEKNDSKIRHAEREEVLYHRDVLALVSCASTEPVGSTTFGAICRKNIDLNSAYRMELRQRLAAAAQGPLGDQALGEKILNTANSDDLIDLAIAVDKRLREKNEELFRTLGGEPRWAVYLESYSRWSAYSEAYLEFSLENKIRLMDKDEARAWFKYYRALREAERVPF